MLRLMQRVLFPTRRAGSALARTELSKRRTLALVTGATALVLAAGAWAVFGHAGRLVLPYASGAWLAFVTAVLLRCARTRWSTIAIVLGGLVVYGVYLQKTPYLVRAIDILGHMKYVDYLLQHGALPAESECNVCHHPPAWHALAAALYGAVRRSAVADPARSLQGLSLLLFSVFLGFSVLSIRRLVRRDWQVNLATALVVLWPYSIINSVRINNDALFYALSAVTIYALLRWVQHLRTGWLVAACACVVVGLFTKSTSLSLLLLVGCVCLVRVVQPHRRRAAAFAGAAAFAVLLSVAGGHALVRGTHGHDVVRNTLGKALRQKAGDVVERTPGYYLTFHPKQFVARTYAEVTAKKREPSYWNHLVKSSLFGTGLSGYPKGTLVPRAKWMRIMNWLVLGLGAALLAGAACIRKGQGQRLGLCAAIAGVFVAAGLAFHLLSPGVYHADFRFVYPALVPMSVVFAYGCEGLRRRAPAARDAAVALACIFLAGAVATLTAMIPQEQQPDDLPELIFSFQPLELRR